MAYVDGYVIPIRKNKVRIYKKMASYGCKMWMKHGALDYYECVGNDLKTKFGLSFPKMCKLKKDETVIFAFIIYRNKAHRNKVNKKVMKEMHSGTDNFEMPFSMERFSYGGFNVLVHAR